ncbi:MAG: UDP-glucose 4-epimerase [candidate division NC10 bacterium RIFCSPLOWO2_12_FULL_66_18]|nr:MAG: UDP-glucose 4-epimerase [candidate division NC10 bacterium RIFCSPLOWO2_12_FULL_66_18]
MPASLVTGAAGFIGSHLCERLLQAGHRVVGLDAFTDYYPRAVKEANLATLRTRPDFRFLEVDLARADLAPVVAEADFIFHQAGQPGVRASWGKEFDVYVEDNIRATQRLLEAARGSTRLQRLVFASSSSVYGEARDLPLREESPTRPYSPYGVTKLAAEHLCALYHSNHGLPTVALRYFTVYGPRQRPDMGFHKFIRAALSDRPIVLYGDGEQTRDFTYVADAVEANWLALAPRAVGEVFNVGGGSRCSVNQVLASLEEILGRPIRRDHRPTQPGDVRHTWADTTRAREVLGFSPRVSLQEGLARQVAWLRMTAPPESG